MKLTITFLHHLLISYDAGGREQEMNRMHTPHLLVAGFVLTYGLNHTYGLFLALT